MKAKKKAKMKAKTLIQSWLEVELESNNKSRVEVLRSLNTKLGSAHTHSRIKEWEENRNSRGERLPRDVRIYMAKIALRSVLSDANIDTDELSAYQLNKMAERLC